MSLVSDLVFDTVVIAAIAVSLGAGVWQCVAEWVFKRRMK